VVSGRRSIEIPGFDHGAVPIPAASRVANVVMTGGISGMDTASGAVPADVREQVRNAFANLRAILGAAGASAEDVVKLSITVRSFDIRAAINEEWLAMCPDEHARPARHVMRYDHFAEPVALQLEAYAVIAPEGASHS
jgi:2-iminobutanoate/2-iminopropanoate deaminase